MKEQLSKDIEAFSSVYDVLPENNAQNRKKKKDYLLKEMNKTKKKIEMVEAEMENRMQRISNLKENPQIQEYEEELEKCSILNEFSPYNTSYEKMHLDYYLYQLHRYYKNDFQEIASCISKIIEAFKNCHITLSFADFDFHPSIQGFMDLFLKNASPSELKSEFETVYWQFPEIINALEVNIKHIYLKYEKQIDKYYSSRHEAFLTSHKEEELKKRKKELISSLILLKKKDAYRHFQRFIQKEYLYSDFKESEIIKKRSLYFNDHSYSARILNALFGILSEYDFILKYDALFKDLRTLIGQRDSFKSEKQSALKAVVKEEKVLYKLLKSNQPSKLFGIKKKKSEDFLFQYKESLNKVIEAYENYDVARFHDNLCRSFPKDSTALVALEFISANYLYFAKIMKETKEDLKESELDFAYQELKELLNTKTFSLLNQIALLDEYQMKQVIVDRYHLDGLKLTIESLEKENLENTLRDIQNMVTYEDIVSSGIKLDDVYFYLEVLKMKDKS